MIETTNKPTALREFRRAGARAFFSRRWFGRALSVTAVLWVLQVLVASSFEQARRKVGFSSWADFMQAKVQAILAGLDYTVPSRTVAWNLTFASAFEMFVSFIFTGICLYGVTLFALRMVRDKSCGYFAGALGGFARPLGLAWLAFRQQLQITLWSFLFLIPGIVATYRYRAAWYLKVEHPDWSAGRCLSESAHVMMGHKWRCFALDCSYWLIITLVLVLIGAHGIIAMLVPALSAVSVPLVLFAITCLLWCVFAGQTVFYLTIIPEKKDSSL